MFFKEKNVFPDNIDISQCFRINIEASLPSHINPNILLKKENIKIYIFIIQTKRYNFSKKLTSINENNYYFVN